MAPLSPQLDLQLELDSLGILRQVLLPPSLSWLQAPDKQLLLDLLFAASAGLSRAYIHKWDHKHKECSMRLSVSSLVDWETDKRGQPVRMTLTWQGEEVAKVLLQVAKHETRPNRYRKPEPVPAAPPPQSA